MESPLHSATPINSRKRPRENETEGQRLKREKAAERQRRKRERDRNINAGISVISQFPPQVDHHHLQQQQQQQQHQQHQLHHPPQPQPIPIPQPTTPVYSNQDLSPEERARRDRVRAAARERQRKHRLLVKQRKMRELGLDMGNEIPGMEDPQYRVNADGQYQQVMQQQPQPPPQAGDIPFPPQGQLGGQTFASTLLLSFSCAPLLKAHLMRTLHMNNDELASLEPVLAEAWERWDHARRAHYAEAVKAGIPVPPPGAGSYAIEIPQDPPPGAYGIPPGAPNGPNSMDASSNEFRARFHRSLAAPTPFRTFAPASASAAEAQQQQQQQQATSTPTSVTSDPIDPHLNASSTTAPGTTATGKGGGGKAAKSEKT